MANYIGVYVSANYPYLPEYNTDPEYQPDLEWGVPPYNKGGPGPAADPHALLAEVLAELDRAEKADPDNALYNLIRWALLVRASCEDCLYSVTD